MGNVTTGPVLHTYTIILIVRSEVDNLLARHVTLLAKYWTNERKFAASDKAESDNNFEKIGRTNTQTYTCANRPHNVTTQEYEK
jgi:hypothetical protein